MGRPLVVTIDGSSGSGKSTLGRELARRLGLRYVDSGAMYRAVALKCLQAVEGTSLNLGELARESRF